MPRFPFPPFSSGWFAIGFSSDFAPGDVVTRHYFGQDLLIYRTRDGVVHAGAPRLNHGARVVSERLRCPLHGWCFDCDVDCVEIAQAERIPPRATLREWPLYERSGVVFVHFDAAESAPSANVPRLPDEDWMSDQRSELHTRGNA